MDLDVNPIADIKAAAVVNFVDDFQLIINAEDLDGLECLDDGVVLFKLIVVVRFLANTGTVCEQGVLAAKLAAQVVGRWHLLAGQRSRLLLDLLRCCQRLKVTESCEIELTIANRSAFVGCLCRGIVAAEDCLAHCGPEVRREMVHALLGSSGSHCRKVLPILQQMELDADTFQQIRTLALLDSADPKILIEVGKRTDFDLDIVHAARALPWHLPLKYVLLAELQPAHLREEEWLVVAHCLLDALSHSWLLNAPSRLFGALLQRPNMWEKAFKPHLERLSTRSGKATRRSNACKHLVPVLARSRIMCTVRRRALRDCLTAKLAAVQHDQCPEHTFVIDSLFVENGDASRDGPSVEIFGLLCKKWDLGQRMRRETLRAFCLSGISSDDENHRTALLRQLPDFIGRLNRSSGAADLFTFWRSTSSALLHCLGRHSNYQRCKTASSLLAILFDARPPRRQPQAYDERQLRSFVDHFFADCYQVPSDVRDTLEAILLDHLVDLIDREEEHLEAAWAWLVHPSFEEAQSGAWRIDLLLRAREKKGIACDGLLARLRQEAVRQWRAVKGSRCSRVVLEGHPVHAVLGLHLRWTPDVPLLREVAAELSRAFRSRLVDSDSPPPAVHLLVGVVHAISRPELREHATTLSCMWLSLQACCTAMPHQKPPLADCIDLLSTIVDSCSHKGAVESAGKVLGDLLATTPPRHIFVWDAFLDLTLERALGCGDRLTTVRRSMELRVVLHAMLTNDPRKSKPFVQKAMLGLMRSFRGADCSVALYCLDPIIRNASLGKYVAAFLPDLTISVLECFKRPSWKVRNAALQVFGSLALRLMGFEMVLEGGRIERSVSAEEFCLKQPALVAYLVQCAKRSQEEQVAFAVALLSLLSMAQCREELRVSSEVGGAVAALRRVAARYMQHGNMLVAAAAVRAYVALGPGLRLLDHARGVLGELAHHANGLRLALLLLDQTWCRMQRYGLHSSQHLAAVADVADRCCSLYRNRAVADVILHSSLLHRPAFAARMGRRCRPQRLERPSQYPLYEGYTLAGLSQHPADLASALDQPGAPSSWTRLLVSQTERTEALFLRVIKFRRNEQVLKCLFAEFSAQDGFLPSLGDIALSPNYGSLYVKMLCLEVVARSRQPTNRDEMLLDIAKELLQVCLADRLDRRADVLPILDGLLGLAAQAWARLEFRTVVLHIMCELLQDESRDVRTRACNICSDHFGIARDRPSQWLWRIASPQVLEPRFGAEATCRFYKEAVVEACRLLAAAKESCSAATRNPFATSFNIYKEPLFVARVFLVYLNSLVRRGVDPDQLTGC